MHENACVKVNILHLEGGEQLVSVQQFKYNTSRHLREGNIVPCMFNTVQNKYNVKTTKQ